MGLEEFTTSDATDEDESDSPAPADIQTPEFVSLWTSEDGTLVMMDIGPQYFREHVSTHTKDKAKDYGLIFLDRTGDQPVIVLTDDPEKYGPLLETFGLEDYLRKRIDGVI